MGSIEIIRFKLFLNDAIIYVVSNKFNYINIITNKRIINKFLGGI